MPDNFSVEIGKDARGRLGHAFRPLEGEQLENPYPFYARARDEEPVFFSAAVDAWVVTRYDDVRAILQQPEIFSSRDTLRPVVEFSPRTFEVLATGYGFTPTITNTDADAHQRFRVPLQHAFRPARVRRMEGAIRTAAEDLLDDLAERGEMDLARDFATPLSRQAILQLCDVPASDFERVVRLFHDTKALTMSVLGPEQQVACAESMVALQHYIADLVERRRAEPQDDLIGSLVGVQADTAAPLSTGEIATTTIGTMMAGYDTTTSLIVNAMLRLLSEPERWAEVRERPDDIPAFLEEALRIDSPVPLFIRTAVRDAVVGGVTVPEGSTLILAYGSANRDESRFRSPETFDASRSPNPHLAFGRGVHTCVGAPLARLEGRVALAALTRLPGLRLRAGQALRHVPTLIFRALERLEVEWDA